MFDRSAAVKLQLRDKKGKWIKMGSHVKWHSLEEGTDVTGIARGEAGNNIIVEFKHAGQTYHINVPHNKVEVINAKAHLDPEYVDHMGGHTNTPNINDHGVTVVHTVTHYGVTSKSPNAPLTTKISDLKPGDVVYPIKNHDENTPSSIQKSPYNVKDPTTKANFQKFATSGHGVVKKVVHDKDTGKPKYAVITDKKGKDHFPSAQHYAIKQHDTLDQAILDGHTHESQAMGHETKSGLVDDVKGVHTTQDKFDASKSPVGTKVESTGINSTIIPLTKTGEDEWTNETNGVKLGNDVVDHMMGPAPEKAPDEHMYIDKAPASDNPFGDNFAKINGLANFKKGDVVVLKDGSIGAWVGKGQLTLEDGSKVPGNRFSVDGKESVIVGKDIAAIYRPKNLVVPTAGPNPFGDGFHGHSFDLSKPNNESFKSGDHVVYGKENNLGKVMSVNPINILVEKLNSDKTVHGTPTIVAGQVHGLYRKDGSSSTPPPVEPKPDDMTDILAKLQKHMEEEEAKKSADSAALIAKLKKDQEDVDANDSAKIAEKKAMEVAQKTVVAPTSAELSAIDHYVMSGATDLNGRLRANDASVKAESEYIDLKSLLEKQKPLNNAITIYRGGNPDHLVGDVKIGETVTDLGFVSTTMNAEQAGIYASKSNNGAVYKINAPKGVQGIDSNGVRNKDASKGLQEFILPPGTQFKITSDSTENGQRVIGMDVVPTSEVEDSSKPINISGWTKKPGTQMGSNAGGIYTDQHGNDWYVKLSQSDDHARSEVLADDLYKAAGIQTSNLKLADVGNGKLGTASQMMSGTQKDVESRLDDAEYMAKIQDGFAMDALLANWDVAGLGYDNVITDEHGNPVRVDPGGALLFRAQGQPKGDQFGNKVGEWESLRGLGSHSNMTAKALFGKMTDQQLADSAKHVEALTPEKINAIVDAIGFDNKTSTELKDKLVARREDILAHAAKLSPAPAEAPAEAPTVEAPTEDAAPKEYKYADLVALPNGAMFSGPSGSLYKQSNKWFMTFTPNSNKDGMSITTSMVQSTLKNKPDFKPVGDTHIVKPMPDTPDENFYDKLPSHDKALLAEGVTHPYGYTSVNDPHHLFPGYNTAEKEQAADFISSSLDVNNALRGDATSDHTFEIAALDQILDKSPLTADTTVYRGLNARDQVVNDLVNGGIYSDKGYTSTSTTDKIGHEWVAYSDGDRTPVLMEIHLPAGFKAHKLDYNALGSHSFSNESEVVLPHGTKFKVTAKEEYTNTSGQTGWKVTMTPYLTEHNFDTGGQNDHTEGSPEGHATGADSEQVHGNGGSGTEDHSGGDNVSGPTDSSTPSAPQEEPAAQGQVAPEAPTSHPDFEATYPDKGKDQTDANGATIKVNDLIHHPKKGVGKVFIGLPSTNSVKVVYPDGSKATHLSKAVTKVEGDAPKVDTLPTDLKVGDHGIDPATHTAFIVGSNNSLIHVGDTVTHSSGDKGVVKGIYKGEKTVKVEWSDGHTSGPKKASTLESENKHVPGEPSAPQNETPAAPQEPAHEPQAPAPAHEEPAPEPVHEPVAEPVQEPAPVSEEGASLVGKSLGDSGVPAVTDLPVGTVIENKSASSTVILTKADNEGMWKTQNGTYMHEGTVEYSQTQNGHDWSIVSVPSGDDDHESAPTNTSPVESLASKSPSQLTKEDLSALPIGTTLHKGPDASFYKKKIGENQWQMTKASTGEPAFAFADSDEATHQALQNSGGAYKIINLPETSGEASSTHESAPATVPATIPSMLHSPTKEDLAKLPDGTVLTDPTLEGFTFTKNGDVWDQQGPAGQNQGLSPNSLVDGSDYHVQAPEGYTVSDEPAANMPTEPVAEPNIVHDPSISTLDGYPDGTILTDSNLEGYSFHKDNGSWTQTGPDGGIYEIGTSTLADGSSYHVQLPPKTLQHLIDTDVDGLLDAPETTQSDDGFKPMSTQELKDFPTGTKITTNHVVSGGYSKPYWVKQSDGTFKEYDELTGFEPTGSSYIAALMSNGFPLKAELPAENAPAADDLTGKPLLDVMHADKFSSLPIGSEIHSKLDDSFAYRKVANNTWNRIYLATGVAALTEYNDKDFTSLEDHALDPYVLGKVGDHPVTPAETASPSYIGKTLTDVMKGDGVSALPVGTELHNGNHVYKKTAPNSWQKMTKDTGALDPMVKEDSAFDNVPASLSDKYTVTESSVPASPEETGTPSLTGVTTGHTISKELLDAQPAGTSMKKESAYGSSAFYYVKQPDATWKLFKNGKETNDAPYMSDGISANTTATISAPTSGSKFFYSKTGEIVYEGDKIDYKGASGTISSITDTGLIAVKLDGENKAKYKTASGLIKTATYGKKGAAEFQPAATPSMATTPSADNHTGGSETANFAGASGAAYDQQGLTMPSTTSDSHLSNGLTLAPTHEADTSNPLYNTPEPQPPVHPAAYPSFHPEDIAPLPKWDSAKWLEAVKARYAANPHKAKPTLEESANWSKIQTILDGEEMHLDSLVNSKYLDEDLKKEAIAGIVAQETKNKPLIDTHKAKVWEAKKQYDAAKAQHLAEYAAQKQEFAQKLDQWVAANPNQNAMKPIHLPETSKESFTGGTADWSKAHAGTFSAQTVFDSIKKDDQLGTKGLSIATDSDQVEALDANVMKILDTSGKPVIEIKMKLTGPYGAAFEKTLKSQQGVTKSNGIFANYLVTDPTTGLLKDHGQPPTGGWKHDGIRYSWTDPSTGASVLFQRSSDQGLNVSSLNNTVRIHLPENATPEDYQKVLENMGVNAKPSSEGDIRVLAENQLLSMMGKSTANTKIYDGDKNHSGATRMNQLTEIEQKYGVTVDDLTFAAEANGRVRFFLKDDKAQALADKYGVKGFEHSVSDSYGADTWINMLTGPNNGLLSTYHRWNEGVGGTGMSSMSDHMYGSSDYVYMTPKSHLPTSNYSVVVNPKAIFRRTDWWTNKSDNYGKKGGGTTTSPYGSLDHAVGSGTYAGGIHEVLPKDSVPVSDWMYVTMGSGTRQEVLKGLKERGVLQINGIPVEEFILTTGATAPTSSVLPTVG